MKVIDDLPQVEVVASQSSWQRLKTFKMRSWARLLLAIGGVAILLLAGVLFALKLPISLFNLMTGKFILPVHKAHLRLRRAIQWMVVASHAALTALFSPKLALAIFMGYCYLRSHDVPDYWLNWMLRLDKRRKC